MKTSLIIILVFMIFSCNRKDQLILAPLEKMEKIDFKSLNLFPEGIAYWEKENQIILGSYGHGDIYQYDRTNHKLSILISDSLLIGPASIAIDNNNDVMYVANGDGGLSNRSSIQSTNKKASLLIYNLKTKERMHNIDLSNLYKGDKTTANGLVLDQENNIYISDSFKPVIYKVEHETLTPSVFVEDERFYGKSYNLNGIAYHPNGYLLALQMGTGEIFKIDIKTKKISLVKLNDKIIGADGITLINNNQILLTQAYEIVNGDFTTGALKTIESSDNWDTATITDKTEDNCLNPTNSVIIKDQIFAINSSIGAYLFQNKDQENYSLSIVNLKKK